MKKLYSLLVLCFVSFAGFGQTAASYLFSQSVGTYTNLPAPTSLLATWDDGSVTGVPLGFSFDYLGTTYTSVNVNANGFINFGPTIGSSYTSLSSTNTRVVSGFNNDLIRIVADITSQTIGTAPNRVFIVQWQDFCHYNVGVDAASGPLNFQIQLYETSNIIRVVYGPMTPTVDPAAGKETMTVGISGATNTDFNNRTTTTNWSATTAGSTNTATCTQNLAIRPVNGLTFQWAPPPSASAAPTSLAFGPVNTGTSAVQSFNISGVNLSPAAGDLTVTAPLPAFYQVSSTGLAGSWGNTCTISYTAGTLSSVPVYVQFNPATLIAYNGDINVTGGGLSSALAIPVTGSGANGCSSTPTAGTVTATPSSGGCTSFATTLTLTGSTVATGLTYQWESSTDDITYTPISGATNDNYSTTISSTIYHRCNVTCTASTITSTTTGLLLTAGPSYATLPFFEGFEGLWVNGCATADIPNNYWRNVPATGNPSWRREDDAPSGGNTAVWTSPTLYAYSPGGSASSHSARFHQGFTTGGGQGKMELYVNLPAGTNQINYDYISGSATTGTNNSIQLQISTDGGATFTNIGTSHNGTSGWTSMTETTTISSPTAILRWVTTSDFGSFDIGLDNVQVFQLFPCIAPTNQPTALTFTPSLFNVSGSFTPATPATDKYMVIMTTTSTAPTAPTNGNLYTVGSTTLGGTVVANGGLTSFTATGLTAGTHYWFWVYGYNSLCTGGPLYCVAAPLTNDVFTNTCSLTGIKTVGPTGDYATITAAISAVMNNGLGGPLAIELQTTYDGTGETYPVVINNPPCGSAVNTLTIRPQGTLTITYGAGTQPFIDLNGARNVIIDGRVGSVGTTKALTITNTNTGGQAIRFINDASNNTVRYCTVRSVNTSTTQGTIFFFTSASGVTGNDNNLIDNCDILDGPTTPVNAIYSTGTTGRENSGNVISNCNIANYFSPSSASYGVFLTTSSTDWTITNNRFYQTATRTFTGSVAHRGINITNTAGNNFVITGNTIGFGSSAGTGTYTMNTSTTTLTPTFQGIALSVGNIVPSSVQGNTISGISHTSASTTSTAGGALCGISITSGSANIGDVTPNIIGAATGNGAIVHNTITNTGGTLVGINGSAGSPASINIQNNIIGGFTLTNGSATTGGGIQGVQISSTGSYSVTGNAIGSASTTNSFYLSTVTTGTQLLYGINSATTTTNLVQPVIANNTISNLTALGTGTASYAAGIVNSSSASPTITGNTIYGISSAAANTTSTGQTAVEGIGHYGNTTSTATITNNTIYRLANTNTAVLGTTVCGIGTTSAIAPQISGNVIYDLRNANTGTTATAPPRAVGIMVGTPTTTGATIYNNMISLGNSQTTNTAFTGIMNTATGTPTMKVYYNTVNIEGSAAAGALPTACMLRGNYSATAFTTPMDVRNNIFNNARNGGTGKHYAIANTIGGTASATGWGANASNYNILNSANAATVGYWSADKTLATWKTASLSDINSNTASAVTFVNSAIGNLHINMGVTPNNIESHGTSIAGFNTDIDNQSRPGPTSINGGGFETDLGADEFDGVAISNLPPSITYTALTNSCGTGDRVLTATIVDANIIPTTGVLQPRIYFKKGAGGTWFSSQGTLASGSGTNGTWNFTISSATLGGLTLGDQVFYYVIAQDGASQIASNPLVGMTATDVNSITTHPTTPNSYNVLLQVSGTIAVGAASAAPYNTITSAVNAYNTGCLSGPVVFSLTDATYPTETFPITVQLNSFASSVNTLTIQPAVGVAVDINGLSGSPAIFKFLNAKYVTLDGVNAGGSSLSLNNNNTGASTTVWFASTTGVGPGNKFITVKNTTILGGSSIVGSPASWAILSGIDNATPNTTGGPDNDDITIQNNYIARASYGLYAFGSASGSAGGLDNWLITGNTFGPAVNDAAFNIMYNGLYMGNALNTTITNNTVQNIGATGLGSQVVGIYLTNYVNGATISQNTVRNLVSNTCSSNAGANFGIGIGNNSNPAINCTITRNTITGITNVYASTCGKSSGIMINSPSGVSNTLVANNMISDISAVSWGTATPAATYMPSGIDIQGGSGGVKIYYNTVNMNTSIAGYNAPTASTCLMINNGTSSGLDIRNNLFNNTYDNTTVTTDKNYAVYSAVSNSGIAAMDNNDYNVVSPNPIAYMFGFQNTLAAVQASYGGNANSLNTAPEFISGTDLHLLSTAANLPLIAGTPAVNGTVSIDFNGTTRSGTTPVIGAHEVVIVNCSGAVAGTATAVNPSFCASGATTINTSGATQGIGASYQWQSSTDSASWSDISGATSLAYTLPAPITTSTYYRFKVGCSFSSTFDSATTKVTINPYPAAITGAPLTCISGTYTYSSATTGGVWESSNPAAATINATTGALSTSGSGGTTVISYTFATGCGIAKSVVVNSVYPTVTPVGTPDIICEEGSTNLSATVTNPGELAYLIEPISYAPVSFTPTGTIDAGTTTTGGSSDDGYYAVNLPFDFRYYGVTYTAGSTCNIGNNGYFIFAGTPFGITIGSIPNGSWPATVSIFGRDLNVGVSGSITYGTTGTAPNRKYIVSFNDVPNFSGGGFKNGQLVLYEGSNNIEYHITSATATHTLGIQSASGSYSAVIPGFNASATPITNSSWRFSIPESIYAWSADPTLSATNISNPTATAINSTTTYTLTFTASNGCATTATTTVTVNPLPAVIGGSLQVCEGLNTTLTNADAGGTWSSSDPAVATIDINTGVVTAIAAGTTTISYTFTTGLGCARSAVLTVNATPAAIVGTPQVCEGSSITLTNADAGGTWTSGNTTVATIGSGTGILSGLVSGTSFITFTLPTSCIRTVMATVNPLPILTVAPLTPTTFCLGNSTSAYSASATMPGFTLLNQNFNSGLGSWTITNNAGTAPQYWQIVATSPDAAGDGSPLMQASANFAAVHTILTSPSFSTFGFSTATLTFNQFLISDVADAGVTLEYSVNNGTSWDTLVNYTAMVIGSGSWVSTSPEATIALPAGALNQPDVRVRWNYNGGYLAWFLDNIAISAELPAATYTWTGGSDLSCTTCTNPTITPSVSGINVYTVSAVSSSSCISQGTVTINVDPLPAVIGGVPAVCEGLTTTLTNTDAGGTWVSTNTSVATIGSISGIVSGLVPGLTVVTYTLPTGCIRTVEVTVNQLPAAITGIMDVCEGLNVTLSDATPGGSWTSSSPSVASIDATTGVVEGILAGTTIITYMLPTGCIETATITVNALPSVITGTLDICEGLTTTLSSTPTGGTWTSNDPSVATIGASTGIVTGVLAGNSMITYMVPTGCIRTAEATVNPLPAAITGTMDVCEGLNVTLSSTTSGGSWTSSNTSVASIDATTGVVEGILAGTTIITYMLPTGCIETATITVNALPSVIAGTLEVCEGLTTTLSSAPTGGTWTSNDPSVATVGASTGIVTGVLAGNSMITYMVPTGCIRTAEATVNPLPAAITGTMDVCEGLNVTLSSTTSGGSWTSSNTSVASIDATTGVVEGILAGTTIITYMLPTGCIETATITVNALPSVIAGTLEVCEGLTTTLSSAPTGGTWTSNDPSVATIGASTGVVTGVLAGTSMITYMLPTGCIRSAEATVNPMPTAITGTMDVCEGLNVTLSSTPSGGSWTSSDPSVASVDATTGVVTGVLGGNATITYMLPAGCMQTAAITVNALPSVIAGTLDVCEGLTTTLSSAPTGGTWTSNDPSVATIGASTGVVTGVLAGNSMITYMLPTGCIRSAEATVNPLPAAITGTMDVCEGLNVTLSSVTSGGTWTSSDPSVASIDATTGVMTGVLAGNTTITYMLATGCIETAAVTVNALPSAITGTQAVCEGLTTTLSSAPTGGSWTSSDPSVATIGASTGVVTGVIVGNTMITYSLPTGCLQAVEVTVNALPVAITGTLQVCASATTTLSNADLGGTWSSSNMTVATISASGVASGLIAGTTTIVYTLPTGCIASAELTVNALPVVYNVTGGGNYCAGGAGMNIGTDNSETGYTYSLYLGASLISTQIGTTGSAIDFGAQTVAGTYSVLATTTASCNSNMSGTATITIIPLVTPSVTMVSTPGDTVCAGTSTTFTATPVNGGTTPAYDWTVNGLAVTSTTDSYNYTPVDGDVISVTMTSNEACPSPATATTSRTMVVVSNETPTVSILVGPNDTICQHSTAVFSVTTSTFGGTSPVYTWYKNTVATGVTGSVYAYVPVNGDVVTVKMNSNYRCPIVNNVASNNITMHVDSVYVPVVTISTNTGLSITTGESVTFTASVTQGGPIPTYQWLKNGTAITGATTAMYTTNTIANNDSVTCVVFGTGLCSYFSFNSVIMKVSTGFDQPVVEGTSNIRLMPNPNTGEFVVNGVLATTNNTEVWLEVTDMLGQVVYKNSIIAKAGNLNERVKLNNTLANGMYILNVRSGSESKVFHFVLKN